MGLEWLFKLFPNFSKIFSNPMIQLGLVAITFICVLAYALYKKYKPEFWVLNFDEGGRKIKHYEIWKQEPRSLKGKENTRFVRNKGTWNWDLNGKTITCCLSKLATAYCFDPEGTPKGKAKRIGSLWDALKGIWGDEECDKLNEELKEPLMQSKIFVTVDIEGGFTPKGLPKMDERDVFDDANQNMAQLIGSTIKHILDKEDWVKNAGLIAMGGLGLVILQTLGVL